MSLLEDVFLQDEADEAQELERVIEGDEYEERVRSDSDDNSERENEAEEDKRRVDPNTTKTRRIIKNPRFTLNPARLTGPRGIQAIPEHFKDFKFKGKGHEKEDLDLVLKKLEHWAYRLYPKFKFEDCLKKIEILGKKRPVMVHLHKIRTDQFMSEETVVQKDSSNEEDENEKEPEDEFDKLLQQQIELARSTPAPHSARKPLDSAEKDIRTSMVPQATSSPTISDELKERIQRNRKLAEERRLARIKNVHLNKSQSNQNLVNNDNIDTIESFNEQNTVDKVKRVNRSNIIDSSDDEVSHEATMNTCVTVDVHTINDQRTGHNDSKSNDDSNNILRMDTDSDMDIQNDNLNTVDSVHEEYNENNETFNQNNINDYCDNNDIANIDKNADSDKHVNGKYELVNDNMLVNGTDNDKVQINDTEVLDSENVHQNNNKIQDKSNDIQILNELGNDKLVDNNNINEDHTNVVNDVSNVEERTKERVENIEINSGNSSNNIEGDIVHIDNESVQKDIDGIMDVDFDEEF